MLIDTWGFTSVLQALVPRGFMHVTVENKLKRQETEPKNGLQVLRRGGGPSPGAEAPGLRTPGSLLGFRAPSTARAPRQPCAQGAPGGRALALTLPAPPPPPPRPSTSRASPPRPGPTKAGVLRRGLHAELGARRGLQLHPCCRPAPLRPLRAQAPGPRGGPAASGCPLAARAPPLNLGCTALRLGWCLLCSQGAASSGCHGKLLWFPNVVFPFGYPKLSGLVWWKRLGGGAGWWREWERTSSRETPTSGRPGEAAAGAPRSRVPSVGQEAQAYRARRTSASRPAASLSTLGMRAGGRVGDSCSRRPKPLPPPPHCQEGWHPLCLLPCWFRKAVTKPPGLIHPLSWPLLTSWVSSGPYCVSPVWISDLAERKSPRTAMKNTDSSMVNPQSLSRIGPRKSSAFWNRHSGNSENGEPAFEKYWPAFSGRLGVTPVVQCHLHTYFLVTTRQFDKDT